MGESRMYALWPTRRNVHPNPWVHEDGSSPKRLAADTYIFSFLPGISREGTPESVRIEEGGGKVLLKEVLSTKAFAALKTIMLLAWNITPKHLELYLASMQDPDADPVDPHAATTSTGVIAAEEVLRCHCRGVSQII